MTHLVSFTLQYDCTASVLQVLSETCCKTLKILDIERSRQVRNDSIPFILACTKLQDLNVFQADFDEEGLTRVLMGLNDLRHLRRGDFLCEVVEYMDSELKTSKKLNIEEFWASEEYFFHSDEQMRLVARYCPKIRQMLFMFQNTHANLMTLTRFEHLVDLELWGGAFYSDCLCDVLEIIGQRLVRLSLVHTEDMDVKAFAIITGID